MKNIFITLSVALAFCFTASADDRPVDFGKLPDAAKDFVTTYYAQDKVISVTRDDDFVRPDYTVILSDGVRIDFEHSGALEKIKVREGAVPDAVVPVQILDYVKRNYPGTFVKEYEIGRVDYEVKLSNRLELKFNANFSLVDVDD